MPSYNEFKSKYIGRYVDVDGFPRHQPYQCWDLVSGVYFPYIGGHTISCTTSGYVKDIANNRAKNGILDFCTDIGLNAELQAGDVCVWGECSETPYSHIAIYDSDYGQDAVYFLGQNQPVPYVNISKIGVSGIIGVFRPKVFEGQKPTPSHKADQILTKGSKVTSNGFYVERIDYQNDWVYNSSVGGWIPASDVDEVDNRDGAKDQWLHIGSGVAFNFGTATVTDVDVAGNRVWLNKLSYPVLASCLYEVED